MKTNLIYFFIFLFCLTGCTQNNLDKKNYFATVKNHPPLNQIRSIDLQAFHLDQIESSYVAFLDINKNNILLIDKKFCYVFFFDKDGHFIKRELGQGQGPHELMTGMIDGYAKIDTSRYFFIGGGNDCHLYNNEFEIQNRYIINKGERKGKANYEKPWIYTLSYEHLLMKNHGEYLYYTVFSEYDDMNFIDSPSEYFIKAHYLCKMNINSGKVENILGKYSSIYDEKKELKQFSFINFDINNIGNFYISFEADSLIYEYDINFLPIKSYGYAGNNMKNADRVLSTFSDFREYYEISRNNSGYYTNIKYINETELLFRCYTRGYKDLEDGLQIYKNGILLGDIDVPKGFKILGYIAPYYYATSGIDEENEIVKIFKFKI